MAIVNMSQFQLTLFSRDKNDLLRDLQKFKYVHFSDLSEMEEEAIELQDPSKEVVAWTEKLNRVDWAINTLSAYVEKPKGLAAYQVETPSMSYDAMESRAQSFDFEGAYRKILMKHEHLEQQISKKEELETSNVEWSHWVTMDFDPSEIQKLQQGIVFIGSVPKKFREPLNHELAKMEYTYFEHVSSDSNNAFVFIITNNVDHDEVLDALRRNSFTSVELKGQRTPKDEIDHNNKMISEVQVEIERLTHEMTALSQEYLLELQIASDYLSNRILQESTQSNFLQSKNVTFMAGYIPTDKYEEFEQTIQKNVGNAYYLQTEDAARDDENVPIMLKNGKLVGYFEPIVATYALPKYNEVDPTPLMAPFYWVFFGMMAADIAYGLIMLIGTTLALQMLKFKEGMRVMVKFFQTLSVSIIIWGCIYASFFGDLVTMPWKPLIDTNTDYVLLVALSIVMGLIHVFFGMAILAYMRIRDKDPMGAIYDVLFWYMALIGAGLFIGAGMAGFPPMVKTVGMWVMIIGMVGVILFSARDEEKPVPRVIWGVYNLYGITSYIGDLVSYTRLMALGLSGGYIAVAINMIVKMLWGSGVPGIIGGIIVFVLFQLFNVFLSMLSAYVHTMRLQYVEFFGKFYEGGGRPFRKFRSKEKYINIE